MRNYTHSIGWSKNLRPCIMNNMYNLIGSLRRNHSSPPDKNKLNYDLHKRYQSLLQQAKTFLPAL